MAHIDLSGMRARLSPERPAICFRGRWWTYAELDQRASQLASLLATRGVGTGDRVGILASNHLAHFDLLHAAGKLGCTVVPFNIRLAAAEQQALLALTEPCVLLHDAARTEQAALSKAALLPLEQLDAALASAPPWTAAASVAEDAIAMLLFTGGSTGTPKAAMLTWRQIQANAINTILGWEIGAKDSVILATPAFHAAVHALATPLLYAGGRVIIQEQFAAADYAQLVQAHQPSLLFMVPTMYQMLIEDPSFAALNLDHVRWAISGGAPCPEPVRAAMRQRGVLFRQGYGLTESGVNNFAIDSAEAAAHPDSVGRPLPQVQAVIRDAQGQPVPAGVSGELTLAGPQLFAGYFGQPEATAEALREGWLWTGDLAQCDAQGRFFIRGRRKEMYISGGENVYPAEVEQALYQLPQIAECAVVGVPHPRWGEVGLAAIVLRAEATLTAEAIQQQLRQTLAGYKRPREIVFLPSLPKSGAGKILKPQIRANWLAEQQEATCA